MHSVYLICIQRNVNTTHIHKHTYTMNPQICLCTAHLHNETYIHSLTHTHTPLVTRDLLFEAMFLFWQNKDTHSSSRPMKKLYEKNLKTLYSLIQQSFLYCVLDLWAYCMAEKQALN